MFLLVFPEGRYFDFGDAADAKLTYVYIYIYLVNIIWGLSRHCVTRGFVAIAAELADKHWMERTDVGFLLWNKLQDTLLVAFRKYKTMIWYACGTRIVNESCEFASPNGNYTFMGIQVNSGLSNGLRTMFIFWDRQ